ncbi:MAG: LamG domain-containing protein, partial [Planctomycetaceae bacterium]
TIVGAQEWVHLALTVSDTTATLYLNGQTEAFRAFSTPLTMILGGGCIGAWNSNGDIQRELNGQMDDVRIYDRALSQEELLWLTGKRTPVHKPF